MMVESIVDAPKITGLKIENADVHVTVVGMSPVATYKVMAGNTPGLFSEEVVANVTTTRNEDGSMDGRFKFAKPTGKFFKVFGVHRRFSQKKSTE